MTVTGMATIMIATRMVTIMNETGMATRMTGMQMADPVMEHDALLPKMGKCFYIPASPFPQNQAVFITRPNTSDPNTLKSSKSRS